MSIAKDNDEATVLLSSNSSVQTVASNSELASVPGKKNCSSAMHF